MLNVRWIHNTATGPTVTDDATPTHRPLNNISNISIIILVRFAATCSNIKSQVRIIGAKIQKNDDILNPLPHKNHHRRK